MVALASAWLNRRIGQDALNQTSTGRSIESGGLRGADRTRRMYAPGCGFAQGPLCIIGL
ncbi:hypothetical protein ACWCO9_08885 [Streptomyces sp. NPDC001937]